MNPSIVGASSTSVACPTRLVLCPETIEAEKSTATATMDIVRIILVIPMESSCAVGRGLPGLLYRVGLPAGRRAAAHIQPGRYAVTALEDGV